MNNMTKWLVLLALTLAPLSAAHDGGVGAPKTHCETPGSDTGHHEYGPPGTGFVIFLGLDGAIPPCPYGDTTWDGHIEFAFGGAWLQASPSLCTEAYADHTPGAFISVYDAFLTAFGSDVAFSVYADTLNNDPIPSEPNCGDFESDYGVDCVNNCAPGFPPGLDGSYQVYVSGTTGHIYDGSGSNYTVLHSLIPGGPTFRSVRGAAPVMTVPPSVVCTDVIPWTGGTGPSGTWEVSCTSATPNFDICRDSSINVYLYSGTGSIRGGVGCGAVSASCDADIGIDDPVIRTCATVASAEAVAPLRCRIDVTSGEPSFAWSAVCSNDP